MLTRAFLDALHCPYCGAPLIFESDQSAGDGALRWGVAHCACYRYPILDGILILRQHSPTFHTANGIIERLDGGDRIGALDYALSATSPVLAPRSSFQHALDRLGRRGVKVELPTRRDTYRRIIEEDAASFRTVLRALRPIHYADYLYYRHANPSFLASIPLLSVFNIVQPGALLDLACGIGHSAFLIQRLFPHLDVIAADHDVVNLYLAKRFIAPDLTYICLDTEYPLPFADETLAGVLCLDGIHYVRSKVALGQELKRVTQQDGVWLFPHLHNALAENVSAGIPLPPDEYLRCFEALNPRLLVEADILRDFKEGHALDFSENPTGKALQQAQVVSLVGADTPKAWVRHDELVSRLTEMDNLCINPIYQVQDSGAVKRLRVAWPSAAFAAECSAAGAVVPPETEIERGLLDRLRAHQLSERDLEQLEALVRSFVLVPLPEGYMLPPAL